MARSERLDGSWIPRPTMLLIFLLAQYTTFFATADDFYLKAAKSVPRIGRRAFGGSRVGGGVRTVTADVDHGFFMKAAKSVPRIGRRRAAHPMASVAEGRDWGLVWPWYRTPDSVPGPTFAEIEPSWMTQRRSGEEGWDGDGVPDWSDGGAVRENRLEKGAGGDAVEEGEEEKMEEERVDEGGRLARVRRLPPGTGAGREGGGGQQGMTR